MRLHICCTRSLVHLGRWRVGPSGCWEALMASFLLLPRRGWNKALHQGSVCATHTHTVGGGGPGGIFPGNFLELSTWGLSLGPATCFTPLPTPHPSGALAGLLAVPGGATLAAMEGWFTSALSVPGPGHA